MRIATAFYDRYGTLISVPERIANPNSAQKLLDSGFPAIPSKFSSEVTLDVGYYHRFTDQYDSPQARARAARDVQKIFDLRNTSIVVDNSHDYWFEIDLRDYDFYVANNIPIPKPGRKYVLDIIYVVEEPDRIPFYKMPMRKVDYNSVSSWINRDPIATTSGNIPIPHPEVATPDRYTKQSRPEYTIA